MKKISSLLLALILTISSMMIVYPVLADTLAIHCQYTFTSTKTHYDETNGSGYMYFCIQVNNDCILQDISIWTEKWYGNNGTLSVNVFNTNDDDWHTIKSGIDVGSKDINDLADGGETEFNFTGGDTLVTGVWYGVAISFSGTSSGVHIGLGGSYDEGQTFVGLVGGASYYSTTGQALMTLYYYPYVKVYGNQVSAGIENLPVSYNKNDDSWQISAKITSLGTSSTGVVWFDYGTTSDMGYEIQATSSDGRGTMRFVIPKDQYTEGDTIYARAMLVLQPPFVSIYSAQYSFSTVNPNITTVSLTTVKARKNGEGVIYAGGVVNNFGLDSTLKADIVYGTTSGNHPFETPIFATLTDVGQIQSYVVDLPKFQSGLTIYYAAHVYGANGGDAYGEEESFNTNDYMASQEAIVKTDYVKKYDYNTATLPMEFLALGTTATSLDLSMWYSTSNAPGAVYTQTDVLTAQTDVGPYDFKITGLQPDTNYYYYASGHSTTGGTTTDVTGLTYSFRTKAIGGGGRLVDKGNDWLLSIGLNKNFWWVVVFILMCLPWVFGPIREMPILGVIIDVIALGIGVTMLFDPWVMVILAIIAAVIIGGVFIKKVVHNE